MSCVNQYTPQLRARGFRMTPQRMTILHILHHEGTHLSPTEIFAIAKETLPGLFSRQWAGLPCPHRQRAPSLRDLPRRSPSPDLPQVRQRSTGRTYHARTPLH